MYMLGFCSVAVTVTYLFITVSGNNLFLHGLCDLVLCDWLLDVILKKSKIPLQGCKENCIYSENIPTNKQTQTSSCHENILFDMKIAMAYFVCCAVFVITAC